jgi:hypothetical protein
MPLFSNLLDFIQNRMRMSHIYQPVMLTTLLRNNGAASVRQIAQQFAQRDEATSSRRAIRMGEPGAECPRSWRWIGRERP